MTNDKRTELVGEIFSITGQKVAIDDPIITAALIQAELIREAGEAAAGVMDRSAQDLVRAAANENEAARAYLENSGHHQQRLDPKQLQMLIAGITNEVSAAIKKESVSTVRLVWTSKVMIATLVMAVLVGAGGVVLGALFGPTFSPSLAPALSREQRSQIHIGQAILRVLPQLDKETRDKLSKLLDQQR